MEMQRRRSRMHRTRTGKRIELTARDIEIFKLLQRYRYLRSTYIHAFVGGASETRFKERLGDLFHEGYLDRPAEQWKFANSRYVPVVHELGAGARQILSNTGIAIDDQRTWLRDTPHRQFEHSVMICEVLASIELGIRGRSDLRLIPWPEILTKAPESTRQSAKPYRLIADDGLSVIPDALFGIEYCRDGRKSYRFFALEADRGTMPLARATNTGTSILAKLEAYCSILAQETYRGSLGVPNLLVLIVTTGETRCTEMMERCSALLADGRPFLFRAFSGATVPNPNLLLAPWQRPGLPPLCITS